MSLLLVNRQIGAEAHDAFFDVNTVRLSKLEDQFCHLDDLRDVELTGEIARGIWDDSSSGFYNMIKIFVTRPKIRLLKIATDFLALPWQRLRWVLEDKIGPRMQLYCIEFGLSELCTPIKTRAEIYLQDYGLMRALPKAKALLSENSLPRLNDTIPQKAAALGRDPSVTVEDVQVMTLAVWLACYECMRKLDARPDGAGLTDEERGITASFEEMYEQLTEIDMSMGQDLPAGLGILGLEDCDEEQDWLLYEWASEVLSEQSAMFSEQARTRLQQNREADAEANASAPGLDES